MNISSIFSTRTLTLLIFIFVVLFVGATFDVRIGLESMETTTNSNEQGESNAGNSNSVGESNAGNSNSVGAPADKKISKALNQQMMEQIMQKK